MKVPQNKTDFKALDSITKEEIILYQDSLLEWLQDINWPVSSKVVTVLKPYVSDIVKGILKILKSTDKEWACNIILHLLTSVEEIPQSIVDEVKLIYNEPPELQELKEVCEIFLKNFASNE